VVEALVQTHTKERKYKRNGENTIIFTTTAAVLVETTLLELHVQLSRQALVCTGFYLKNINGSRYARKLKEG